MERQKKFLYDCGFTLDAINGTIDKMRREGHDGEISTCDLIDKIYEEFNDTSLTAMRDPMGTRECEGASASLSALTLVERPPDVKPKVKPTLQQLISQRCTELRSAIDELRYMCKLCNCSDATILLLPCGHLASCGDCLQDVRRCPIGRCNKIVRGTKEIFFA